MENLAPFCYLASVETFGAFLRGGMCLPDASRVTYCKQTSFSRCRIDSPAGALTLSLPVVNPHGRAPLSEILISEHGNWRHQHWNALVSSYRHTPYFDYYEEDFRPFYTEHNWERLVDFNKDMYDVILRLIGPTQPLPKERALECTPYYQVFAGRHGFLPNLSIVDLLFNMGPESVYML